MPRSAQALRTLAVRSSRGRCKRFKYQIYSDAGRSIHGAAYDVAACARDPVECKKAQIACLGTCGGVDGSTYHHDFATIVARTELSVEALGDEYAASAAANCTVRSVTFRVPTFDGGDSFAQWSARTAARSKLCNVKPQSQLRHVPC